MCEELTREGLLTLPSVAPRVERLLMARTADDEALATLYTMRHLAALDLGECTQVRPCGVGLFLGVPGENAERYGSGLGLG